MGVLEPHAESATARHGSFALLQWLVVPILALLVLRRRARTD